MSDLRLEGLGKRFGATEALQPTDLAVAEGEFVVIMGPSGCGKSTLLRLVAGLEEPTSGRVLIGGRDVTDLAPARRGVAMVFQSYALYPHLTVAENIAFPLKAARRPAAEIKRRVAATAETLGLDELLQRRPRELSGGERQRVSIGRAIVREPGVLLLDEPLSNLDAALRVRLRREFARLHQQLGVTMVHVTHDQQEAMSLAERIVVMDAGRVLQAASPAMLYAEPTDLSVALAIGSPPMNTFPVTVEGEEANGALVRLASGQPLLAAVRARHSPAGVQAILGVRAEHLVPAAGGPIVGVVELLEATGPASLVHLRGDGGASFDARAPAGAPTRIGERLSFTAEAAHAHLFDAATGAAFPRL